MAYTIATKTFSAYKSNVGTVGKEVVDWILEQCPALSLDSKTGTASATSYAAYLKYKDYPILMYMSWSSTAWFYTYGITGGSYAQVKTNSDYSQNSIYFTGETQAAAKTCTIRLLCVDDSLVCISIHEGSSRTVGYCWKFGEYEHIATGELHGYLYGSRLTWSYSTPSEELYKASRGYVYIPSKDNFYSVSETSLGCSGLLGDTTESPYLCAVIDPLFSSTGGAFTSHGLLEKYITVNNGVKPSTVTDTPIQIGDHKYLFSYGSFGYGAVMVE